MKFIIALALCVSTVLATVNWNRPLEIESEELFMENFGRRLVPTPRHSDVSMQKPGKVLQYSYEGQALTGIPGSSKEHSGTKITCLVTIQNMEEERHVVKLEHIHIGETIEMVRHPRKTLPWNQFKDVEIAEELKQDLLKPFIIQLSANNEITQIRFEPEESIFSTNIKRGIVSLLQAKVQSYDSAIQIENQRQRSEKMFTTEEITVQGKCPVSYVVESEPCRTDKIHCYKEVLNVTKSINYENCEHRPQTRYNWHLTAPCPSCDPRFNNKAEKFLKSSTVLRLNMTGNVEHNLIESCISEEQHTVMLLGEESSVIQVYVNQTITLMHAQEHTTLQGLEEVDQNVEQSSEIQFSNEWDTLKELFFAVGDRRFLEKTPFDVKNPVKMAKLIIEELTKSEEEDEWISMLQPRLFSRLVTVIRLMKNEQMKQLLSELEEVTSQHFDERDVKSITLNAIAAAGTFESMKVIKEQAESESKTSKYDAVNAIRQLASARVVSKKSIEIIKELCETSRVKESFALRQQCYLTLSSIANTLCDPRYMNRWAIRPEWHSYEMLSDVPNWENRRDLRAHVDVNDELLKCTEETQKELINFFINKMESTDQVSEKVLYIKAIGNMKLPETLKSEKLQKIVLGESETKSKQPIVRMQAIMALAESMHQINPYSYRWNSDRETNTYIELLLTPIFMNIQEPPLVRMSAAFFVINSQPKRNHLNIIARQINNERNPEVASFVYSLMTNLAHSTQPCHQNLTHDLKLALRLVNRVPVEFFRSSMISKGIHSYSKKLGIDLNLAKTFSNMTAMPSSLHAALNTNFLGFFNRLASVDIIAENVHDLLFYLMSSRGLVHEKIRGTRHQKDNIEELLMELDQIEIEQRRTPFGKEFLEKYPESSDRSVDLSLNFLSNTIAFASTDLALIKDYLTEWKNMESSEFEKTWQLRKSYASMLSESSLKIATGLGLPLVISTKVPLVAKINAKLDGVEKKVEAIPQITIAHLIKVELWSPVVNSGFKLASEAQIKLPIDLKYNYNKEEKKVQITMNTPKLDWREPDRHLVRVTTTPQLMTFTWKQQMTRWLEPKLRTLKGEEAHRVMKINREYLRNTVPVNVHARYHFHQNRHLTGVPVSLLLGPNELFITAKSSPIQKIVIAAEKISWMEDASQPELPEGVSNSKNAIKPRKIEGRIRILADNEIKFETQCKAIAGREMLYGSELDCIIVKGDQNMCLKKRMYFPKKPFTREDIQEESKHKVLGDMKVTWGNSQCEEGNKVYLKLVAKRSQRQIAHDRTALRQELETCRRSENDSPMSCYQYLKAASDLMKYDVEINYNNVAPAIKNVTIKLLRLAQAKLWSQCDINEINVENPENKITASLELDPWSKQLVNITMKTPRSNIIFRDVPLPMEVKPLNTKYSNIRRMFGLDTKKMTPMCAVKEDKSIVTFDSHEFKLPQMTDCWTVLSKDCSKQVSYSVLMKKDPKNAEKKVVKISIRPKSIVLQKIDNTYILKPTLESTGVEITQEAIEHEEDNHNILSVRLDGEKYVKVELIEERVNVYFDGETIIVKASPMYIGLTCGLCGDYNGDRFNEFDQPEVPRDLRSFFKRMTLKQSCTFPEKLEELCDDAECKIRQPKWLEESYESNEELSSDEVEEPEPLQRFIRTEDSYRVCISNHKQPVCPRGSVPQKKWQQVQWKCVSRDTRLARRIQRLVMTDTEEVEISREHMDVQPTHFVFDKEVAVAKKCTKW